MGRAFSWIAATLLLAIGPLDDWLDGTMARLVLLQIPAWFALGWMGSGRCLPLAAARLLDARLARWDPLGLSGLALTLGILGFWMIPRSIDAMGSSALVDQLLHASVLLAGACAASSARRLPFVARAALGIYGTSMTFALGVFYSKYTALLCGAFSLAQQKELGGGLLALSPVVLIAVLATGARALAQEGAPRRRKSPAEPEDSTSSAR